MTITLIRSNDKIQFLTRGLSTFEGQLARDRAEEAAERSEEARDRSEPAADRSEAARDIAQGFAGDIVAQGNVPIYASRTTASTYDLSAFSSVIIQHPTKDTELAPATYRKVAAEPAHPGKFQSLDGSWFEDPFFADRVVRIPADYPTLQDAVDALSRQPMQNGARIILVIQSGHRLTKGLEVRQADFSHFWIAAEDPIVYLAEGFTGPTDAGFVGDLNVSTNILFFGANARMPTLDCLIDAEARCSHGYYGNGSIGIINTGAGVRRCGRIGLYGVASLLRANRSDWQYAGQWRDAGFQVGIWSTNGSIITAQDYTNVSYSTAIGAGTSRASMLNAQRLIANFCEQQVIEARRGFIDVRFADLSQNGQGINAIDAVRVSAGGSTLTGMVTAVRVSGGALVDVTGASMDLGLANCSTVSKGAVRPLRAFNLLDSGTVVNEAAPAAGATVRSKSSNFAVTGTAFASDPQLQIGVRPGDVLIVKGEIRYLTSTGTTLEIALGGAAASSVLVRGDIRPGTTAPFSVTAYDTAFATIPESSQGVLSFTARVTISDSGFLTLRARRPSGTGSASILSCSTLEVRREG